MRHITIARLALVALFVTAASSGGHAAHAQDTTPTTLSPLLQQLVAAFNAGDAAAIAAFYSSDGTHEDIPAGITARGQEEITAFVDETLAPFRDVRFEPVAAHQADDLAVLEYTFSVTDRATDQELSYRGVLIFELDGSLIRRSADYYDLAAILGQLGRLDLNEAAPEATPAP